MRRDAPGGRGGHRRRTARDRSARVVGATPGGRGRVGVTTLWERTPPAASFLRSVLPGVCGRADLAYECREGSPGADACHPRRATGR